MIQFFFGGFYYFSPVRLYELEDGIWMWLLVVKALAVVVAAPGGPERGDEEVGGQQQVGQAEQQERHQQAKLHRSDRLRD